MGVDAVKFQHLIHELTLSNNRLAVYQKVNIKKKITPIDLLKLVLYHMIIIENCMIIAEN